MMFSKLVKIKLMKLFRSLSIRLLFTWNSTAFLTGADRSASFTIYNRALISNLTKHTPAFTLESRSDVLIHYTHF
jgi:hypothetical protein